MTDPSPARRVALVADTAFYVGPAIARLLAARGHDLVIGDPAKYAPDHARVVPDDTPGTGPLGGIITALKHAR